VPAVVPNGRPGGIRGEYPPTPNDAR